MCTSVSKESTLEPTYTLGKSSKINIKKENKHPALCSQALDGAEDILLWWTFARHQLAGFWWKSCPK